MRAKKFLSMLLVVVMMLSLFPMNAFALGGGREIGIGGGFGRDIGDDEIREFDPTDYEAEGEDPVDFFQTTDYESGITVTVESPFNALPTKAEVRLQPVDPESVREAVESVVDGQPNILVAMDISFWLDGQEIEPDQPVNVKISAPELTDKQNLQVVHIPDAGEENAQPNTVELVTEEEMSIPVGTNEIAFKANSFSVYAVIGEGDYTRATVNFISKGTNIGSMIVKPSDTLEELAGIVYDPGVGTLESGEQFLGWTLTEEYTAESQRKTISEVRQYLAEKEITDGETINFYAVIGKTVTLTFLDDKEIAIQADSAVLIGSATTVEITVNANAPAIDSEHNFEGWNVNSGGGNIVSAKDSSGNDVEAPYPNGTVLTLKGNVALSVYAPLGHWLVFNENGKGATYCAPRFLESNEITERPRPDEEMVRNGYTFVDWYEAELDSEGKPQMQDGKVVLKRDPFVFGNTISERVELFAKWTEKDSANFTVVIWRQNVECKGYDFAESVMLSGSVNTDITDSQVSYSGKLGEKDAYAIVNGTSYRGTDGEYEKNKETASPYCGFHLQSITYGPNDKNINPEGNTVVNIYYDRNEYTLTFKDGSVKSYITYVYKSREYSDAELGDKVTNSQQLELLESEDISSVKKTVSGYEVVYIGSGYYSYIKIDGTWYYINSEAEYVYNADSITSVPSGPSGVVKTITAKFGQNIYNNFDIVGTNGTTYTGGRWKPGTNPGGWGEVMAYIVTMPSMDVTFTLDTESRPLKTIYYYVEALPDDTNTVDAPATLYDQNNRETSGASGKKFVELHKVEARYNGVTIEDLLDLPGFTMIGLDSTKDSNGFWIYNTSEPGTLKIYYKRDFFVINYKDGVYLDGSNNPVNEPKEAGFGQSEQLMYGADISSYGEGGDNYKTPTKAGYVFEGWYLDDNGQSPAKFTDMPLGGITVYAKWHQIQYRVFLHPDAGTDNTLSWGDEGRVDEHGNPAPQQMNFRITYGGKISVPEGTRTGYKFLGWYRDPGKTQVFNADAFVLNDSTVTTAYNKDKDFTDPMDKWGNNATTNADVNRPWITRKFDLYARWSAVLVGADGIGILYDAGDGSNAPQDQTLYIDSAKAIAQAASTAPEGKEFKCWVLQTWNETEGKYVDTKTTVEPGAEFDVLKANARQQERENHTEDNPSYSYTVKLRAEYKDKEVATPSHIYWYANNGSTGVQKDENVQINKGVDIPTQANWTPTTIDVGTASSENPTRGAEDSMPPALINGNAVFLGWARVVARDGKFYKDDNTTEITVKDNVLELTGDDLFLKWVDATANGESQIEAGHYQAKVNGEWTNVTQVACDEKNPYHDLYAVWGTAFYVYHTGTNKVERILLSGNAVDTQGVANTFDLTALVDTKNFLYGGYYKAYNGTSAGTGTFSVGSLSWIVPAANAYADGTQMNSYATGGLVATATDAGTAYTGQAGAFNLANAYKKGTDDPGNAIHPVAGTVYYIKEVPADKFLQPKLRYTYRTIDGKIGASWLFTNTDDENYDFVGFMIDNTNNNTADAKNIIATGKGIATFMIEAYTTHNKTVFYNGKTEPEHDGDDKTTYTKLYDKGLTAYLLVYYNDKLYGEGNKNNVAAPEGFKNILTEGATNQMFWVTPDGMKVTSTAFRTYRNITTTALVAEKPSENPASVISVYES